MTKIVFVRFDFKLIHNGISPCNRVQSVVFKGLIERGVIWHCKHCLEVKCYEFRISFFFINVSRRSCWLVGAYAGVM